MHDKVLEVENMLANPRERSFLAAHRIGSNNCAAIKNCAKVNDVYLENLIIIKKSGMNHHLDYRFFKGCLIPGKIKLQVVKPLSVNSFSHIPSPGLIFCTIFRIYNVDALW
jgi:Pyruvate/2-oxoacid:ferredoxin oxidoreductase delta subunit